MTLNVGQAAKGIFQGGSPAEGSDSLLTQDS